MSTDQDRTLRALFSARDDDWEEWRSALSAAFAARGLKVDLSRSFADPAEVDAIIYAPTGPVKDFTPYVNVGLVQSLWAGVERIVGDRTLTQPLARMVDPGLRQSMVEWCLGWVLRFHLGMDNYRQDGVWRHRVVPPLASDRHVVIAGMGELGGAVAGMLASVGFRVTGWSASGRGGGGSVDGVEMLAGDALPLALSRADFLITLLPDTPGTRGLLNESTLAMLPKGAVILNPGRGPLISDDALLAALDSGHVRHAVLDVFRTEPLPPEHPFWHHPAVTVTPHIAAETKPSTASTVVAENLVRLRDGQPFLHLVDRDRGY
ncbi:2-hydroxyacid dehydrogenase [Paracoccus pacificus]|uniref:2-hydroxyacid dehydrogenase n=1 Tax=Paracoccus pacificus TaxID=1463598 RepID=A0ABW4RBX3_9RHOB